MAQKQDKTKQLNNKQKVIQRYTNWSKLKKGAHTNQWKDRGGVKKTEINQKTLGHIAYHHGSHNIKQETVKWYA